MCLRYLLQRCPLCLTDSPGKSVSLIYILLRRLVAGKPVALQTQPHGLWLFHNGGATACKGGSSYPMIRLSKHIGERIWYLCDSNNDFKVPMKVPALHIYTVLTSSPRTDRYGEFAKLSECFFVVMDVWTERELRTLA